MAAPEISGILLGDVELVPFPVTGRLEVITMYEGAGINDGLSRILWTFSDSMDFTVYSIRCVNRAELIFGR